MTMCCCSNGKLKRHLYTQTYSHNRTTCNLLHSKEREAKAERTTVNQICTCQMFGWGGRLGDFIYLEGNNIVLGLSLSKEIHLR